MLQFKRCLEHRQSNGWACMANSPIHHSQTEVSEAWEDVLYDLENQLSKVTSQLTEHDEYPPGAVLTWSSILALITVVRDVPRMIFPFLITKSYMVAFPSNNYLKCRAISGFKNFWISKA